MKDEKILTASEVLKMLERPVVIAYGRETFDRLLKNQRHTMICTRYPADIEVIEQCAHLLHQRLDIGVFTGYEKTRFGQAVCYLLMEKVGRLFTLAGEDIWILKRDYDFLVKHKNDFPPNTSEEVETLALELNMLFTPLEEALIYDFEEAYNTHLWETTISIEEACERIQSLTDKVWKYYFNHERRKRVYELRQYIRKKRGDLKCW